MKCCAECGEETEELVSVGVGGSKRRLCEECAEDMKHEAEIADEAEASMREMMEYKGR